MLISAVDTVVCQTLVGVSGTVLAQSQISAGRVDNRLLGAADKGLALAYGVAIPFAQRGCSKGLEAVVNYVASSKSAARDIVNNKDQKVNSINGPIGRKMLYDKFIEQDNWTDWTLSQAQASRDDVEEAKNSLTGYLEARKQCWGITYLFCIRHLNGKIALSQLKLYDAVVDFRKNLVAVGQPLIHRAGLLGMALPDTNSLRQPTYDIN